MHSVPFCKLQMRFEQAIYTTDWQLGLVRRTMHQMTDHKIQLTVHHCIRKVLVVFDSLVVLVKRWRIVRMNQILKPVHKIQERMFVHKNLEQKSVRKIRQMKIVHMLLPVHMKMKHYFVHKQMVAVGMLVVRLLQRHSVLVIEEFQLGLVVVWEDDHPWERIRFRQRCKLL